MGVSEIGYAPIEAAALPDGVYNAGPRYVLLTLSLIHI